MRKTKQTKLTENDFSKADNNAKTITISNNIAILAISTPKQECQWFLHIYCDKIFHSSFFRWTFYQEIFNISSISKLYYYLKNATLYQRLTISLKHNITIKLCSPLLYPMLCEVCMLHCLSNRIFIHMIFLFSVQIVSR